MKKQKDLPVWQFLAITIVILYLTQMLEQW
jgi:hypothetical protein